MPHFIAECTENIREQADLPGLFSKVNEALAASRWLTVSMITRLCI